MKFYVAAKWQYKDEVRTIYKKIREKGHTITEDWTKHPSLTPYDKHPKLSRKFSIIDINAIRRSDVLILLSNRVGAGMYVELGAAIISKLEKKKPKKIYVIGKNLAKSTFYFHPNVKRRKTIEDVFDDLKI